MVFCTANDLQQWKDFPKGLKVLLLEGDTNSASDIKSKLESMDYIVSEFCHEDEALSAIASRTDGFHIAIVEVSISSGQGGFKFLENAKELPTIMTSNNHCLNTMMKCIALGAVEFLSKPLSEEKLRNIWQHVVHKAFNAGATVMSESLKPVKESVASMLQLLDDGGQQGITSTNNDHDSGSDKYPAPSTPQLNRGTRLTDDGDFQEQTNCSTEKDSSEHDRESESKPLETRCENLNAESDPQSMERDGGEGESKSAEITCKNLNAESAGQPVENGGREDEAKSAETACGKWHAESTHQPRELDVEGGYRSAETRCEKLNVESTSQPLEHDVEGQSKSAETTCENLNAESSPQPMEHDGEGELKSDETTRKHLNAESNVQPMDSENILVMEEQDFAKGSIVEMHSTTVCSNPQNRKVRSSTDGSKNSSSKAGVLRDSSAAKAHRKKMKVDWTPELHKKFVKAVEQLGLDQAIPSRILDLMKVEGLTRHNVASHLQKYRMHKRQILPKDEDRKWLNQRDPMQRSYRLQRPIMAFPPYHHPNHTLSPAPVYPTHVWGPPPSYPMWQPTENWHWKPLPGMYADAWGCPVFPPPQAPPCFSYPQNMPGLHNTNAGDYKFSLPQKPFEHYPEDEVVDKVVKEAITKPWLPLPLGLKPPSTDFVLAELSRQGISTVPEEEPLGTHGAPHKTVLHNKATLKIQQ